MEAFSCVALGLPIDDGVHRRRAEELRTARALKLSERPDLKAGYQKVAVLVIRWEHDEFKERRNREVRTEIFARNASDAC